MGLKNTSPIFADHECLFELILTSTVRFPDHISPEAKDLLGALLIRDPQRRYKTYFLYKIVILSALAAAPMMRVRSCATRSSPTLTGRRCITSRCIQLIFLHFLFEIEPPFKPGVTDDTDTRYFDQEFTNEPVQLTPTSSAVGHGGHLDTIGEEPGDAQPGGGDHFCIFQLAEYPQFHQFSFYGPRVEAGRTGDADEADPEWWS